MNYRQKLDAVLVYFLRKHNNSSFVLPKTFYHELESELKFSHEDITAIINHLSRDNYLDVIYVESELVPKYMTPKSARISYNGILFWNNGLGGYHLNSIYAKLRRQGDWVKFTIPIIISLISLTISAYSSCNSKKQEQHTTAK